MGYGYATQALEFVLNYSFNELNLKKVIAETQTQNKASIKLLERVGMVFEKSVERFGSNQSIFLLLITSISININNAFINRHKKGKIKSCLSFAYSHSIVAGGLDDTSYTTRDTSLISFIIRVEILSTNSYGKCAKRAVIKSTVSTARSAITHA